jgi:hypothetical protein
MLAPPERIQLRDKDGRLIEYGDTEQIRRWRRRLETFNEAVSALTVSLDGCVIREGEPLVTPKNRVGASTVTMFRVFNRTFKMGGRFYGPWVQNIEKELRGRIQINGYPTDEPDYREHHTWLLYNALGRQMPAEPFILGGWDRKMVKAAFYTLLNAESPIAACTRLTRPRDARLNQNGLGSPVVRPLSEGGRCAECTAHTAVRLKASGMAITGTAAERRK